LGFDPPEAHHALEIASIKSILTNDRFRFISELNRVYGSYIKIVRNSVLSVL
jgi:hypothetical protein